MTKEDEAAKETDNIQIPGLNKESDNKIETTEEELEGYMIVKSILRQKIDCKRITYRDAQSYFAILLDDNNRKPICRLYFNGTKKYLTVLDESRKEVRNEIKTLDDIFLFSDLLIQIADGYNKGKEKI